jgi:DNA-directed RNA polymerase specialized sigma24 family protein
MPYDDGRFTACDEFIESRLAKITKLVHLMLNVGNCTDPSGHTGEVVHEVYLKVRNSWEDLRSPENVINTITANTARTHAHKCRREPPKEMDENVIPWLTQGAQDPEAIYEQAILIEQLLNQLDPLDQYIISMLFQGWSFTEISVPLDIPSGTLRSRYSRAVNQLKRANAPWTDAA